MVAIHLPEEVTKADLHKLFSQFGEIWRIFLHANKGFAFVDFKSVKSVQNAVKVSLGLESVKRGRVRIRKGDTKMGGDFSSREVEIRKERYETKPDIQSATRDTKMELRNGS